MHDFDDLENKLSDRLTNPSFGRYRPKAVSIALITMAEDVALHSDPGNAWGICMG